MFVESYNSKTKVACISELSGEIFKGPKFSWKANLKTCDLHAFAIFSVVGSLLKGEPSLAL